MRIYRPSHPKREIEGMRNRLIKKIDLRCDPRIARPVYVAFSQRACSGCKQGNLTSSRKTTDPNAELIRDTFKGTTHSTSTPLSIS